MLLIRMETVKITTQEAFYERDAFWQDWTVVLIGTQRNVKPLSFRISNTWSVEQWQLNKMLEYAGVSKTKDLVGKEVSVIVCGGHVMGFGNPEQERFFLISCSDMREFTKDEVNSLACGDSAFIKPMSAVI